MPITRYGNSISMNLHTLRTLADKTRVVCEYEIPLVSTIVLLGNRSRPGWKHWCRLLNTYEIKHTVLDMDEVGHDTGHMQSVIREHDLLFVINGQDFIPAHMCDEIHYALAQSKEVMFTVPFHMTDVGDIWRTYVAEVRYSS